MASNFRLSSSVDVLTRTWANKSQASAYDWRAPSKFCALSSWTAVFARCSARESIAFCEGGLPPLSLALEDVESALPLAFWERLREWPLATYASAPRS